MKKLVKGRPGYIRRRKNRYLMWAILEFAVVLLLFALGIWQTGSRKNILTIVAIVGCLPAAKMLVEYIVMFPFNGISKSCGKEIKEKAGLLTIAYDLIFTCNEKLMQVDAIVISDHVVCGYTSCEKTDEKAVTDMLKNLLSSENYEKMTVKIFHDYTAFLSRAEGLNSMAEVSNTSPGRKEKGIRHLFLSVSM